MYTVEVYKSDRRTRSGERLVLKQDYDTDNLSMLEHTVRHTWLKSQGYRYEIHATYVTRTNMMSGREYQERYDTPNFCSPSSEAYWSM
jgi:hypothetical protein